MKRLVPIAALGGVVVFVWLLQEIGTKPPFERDTYNVVVISMDGWREDHRSGAGYPRATTPHLDALAEGAITFEQAFTPTPDSFEAHASLFTSMWPTTHGANQALNQPLRDDWITFAEELQVSGYDTVAFVDGGDLDPQWKLNQGFFRYDLVPRHETEASNSLAKFRRKIYDANQWLASREGVDERPFFLFFHSRVLRPPFQSPYPRNETFDPDYPDPSRRVVTLDDVRKIERGEKRLDASEVRHVIAQYDAELATVDFYLDDWLRRLFEGGGFADNTVFVLLSTQGMELLEHGTVGADSKLLVDTSLHVPLLWWVPGMDGRVVGSQVRLIDVLPTLYDLLGLEPTAPMQGESLVSHMLGRTAVDLPAFSEVYDKTYEIYSLREDGARILWDRKLPEPVFFDCDVDPDNTLNLKSEQPERAEALRTRLDEMLREAREFDAGFAP